MEMGIRSPCFALCFILESFAVSSGLGDSIERRNELTRQECANAIRKLGGSIFREDGKLEVWLCGQSVSDDSLDYLEPFDDLSLLVVSESRIGNAGLAKLKHLTQLRRLDLSNTRVTGEGLKHLCPLSKLIGLELANNSMTSIEGHAHHREV